MAVRYTRPLDGGWGYAVVLAVFVITACSVGVSRSFGVFFEEFSVQFDQPATATSWVISTCIGLTFAGAFFGSMFGTMFGFRPVAMVGGVLAAVGCILTSFATSTDHLYVTIGVMVGFGSSLAVFPSLSLVGKYFEKRRAIANGIAFAGAGVGNIVFPPVFTYLIEEYGWRGSFLIAAGVLLNITAFAALLRPIHLSVAPEPQPPPLSDKTDKTTEIKAYTNAAFSSDLSDILVDEAAVGIKWAKLPEPQPPWLVESTVQTTEAQGYANEAFSQELRGIELDEAMVGTNWSRLFDPQTPSLTDPTVKTGESQGHTNKAFSQEVSDIKVGQHEVGKNIEEKENTLSDDASKDRTSCTIWFTTMAEFKTFLSCPSLVCFIAAQICFLGFGMFIPIVHIAPRGRHLLFEEYESALLVSMISIGDLIGRLISGFLPTCSRFRHLHWYIFLILMLGVACLLSPLAKTYPTLAAYCIAAGLLIGSAFTISLTVLAGLVGPARLSNAMGLMMLLMSITIFGAPPLAGKLFDVTGEYDLSFIVAGCGPCLAGVVSAILLCLRNDAARRVSGRKVYPS